MNTDYYVYERFRKDDNTCFYVGQGRKKDILHLQEINCMMQLQ